MFLGCAMAQKPGKGDDVIFLNAIFGVSKCRTWKWMTFLEPLDKTEQDRCIFVGKFWNLTYFDLVWPEVDLSLCQILKN